MEIIRSLDTLPDIEKPVATMGVFDGVHQAHQRMIRLVGEEAKQLGGRSVVITFDVHPCKIVAPHRYGTDLFLLTTLEEKIERLEKLPVDILWILPFTKHLASLSYQEFAETVFFDTLRPHTILTGYNHNFGNDREGNFEKLKALAGDRCRIERFSQQQIDHLHISSTEIRNHLLVGDLQSAHRLLGYEYALQGRIRKTQFTLADDDKLIPAFGTYRASLQTHWHTYPCHCHIQHSIEIHNDLGLSENATLILHEKLDLS